jgi:hypothetical protein
MPGEKKLSKDRWVLVTMFAADLFPGSIYTGISQSYQGRLTGLTEDFLLLENDDGETLELSRKHIQRIQEIEIPEEEMYLRSAENPDEPELLRPAFGSGVDEDELLRTVEPPEDLR